MACVEPSWRLVSPLETRSETSMRIRPVLAWLLCPAAAFSCGQGDVIELVCEPGETQACVCPGGGSGAQVCFDSGAGWGACEGCTGARPQGGGVDCQPGETRLCTCQDGKSSAQVCNAEGNAWGACEGCAGGSPQADTYILCLASDTFDGLCASDPPGYLCAGICAYERDVCGEDLCGQDIGWYVACLTVHAEDAAVDCADYLCWLHSLTKAGDTQSCI